MSYWKNLYSYSYFLCSKSLSRSTLTRVVVHIVFSLNQEFLMSNIDYYSRKTYLKICEVKQERAGYDGCDQRAECWYSCTTTIQSREANIIVVWKWCHDKSQSLTRRCRVGCILSRGSGRAASYKDKSSCFSSHSHLSTIFCHDLVLPASISPLLW